MANFENQTQRNRQIETIIAEAQRRISNIIHDEVFVIYKIVRSFDPADLVDAIEKVMGISYKQMLQRTRKEEICRARHVYFYMMRAQTLPPTFQTLASEFDAHHSTVMAGVKAIKDLLDTGDPTVTNWINEIKNILADAVEVNA